MGKRVNSGSTWQLRVVIIISITVLLFCCHLWGLDPDKRIDQYLLDHWQMSDGFPSNEITSIAQTPDGYLWIATSKGLVRFDGMKFSIIDFAKKEKISPLKTATPITLFSDKQGILWIGSSAGLTSYHRQTGRFKTFTKADGLSENKIRCIKEDMRGDLWISFMSGYLDRYSNGEFTAFNASYGLKQRINAIVEDHKGNLLFGTRENGIFEYKDGKFFKRHIPDLDKLQLTTMVEDRKGVLWIGTNKGLLRVKGKNSRKYTTNDGLSDDYILDILEDSERNLWIGTLKGGLNRIKRRSNEKIGLESVLKSFKIFCLFEDREKNLWIGTLDSGLKRLKDGKFISYAPLAAHSDEILLSVYRDRHGDTWIGTLSGKLFRCRGRELIESLEYQGLPGTGITALEEDAAGNLWLGSNGKGVFQKKGGAFVRFTTREGLADNMVNSIFKDSRGNLWFCTFDGVSVRWSQSGIIESFTSRDGLLGKVVHNVYEDRARSIWIAADKGITILEKAFAGGVGGQFSRKAPPYPPEAGIKHYLKGIPFTCIYEDPSVSEGEVPVYWIATDGAGLKRLRLKDSAVTAYTTNHGMTNNVIYQFIADQEGNFWFMSNRGVLRVRKSELNHLADGKVEHVHCTSFDTADGMKSSEFNNEFSRHSALKTRSGELWFVTKKGISIVNPAEISINKTPPQVVIEQVFFDEKSIPLHLDADAYRFKGVRNFSVFFTAPTFLSPGKIKFKYRLDGVDNKWVYLFPGKERAARYQDLKPGTYTFRVTACNADGVWNTSDASFTFTLKSFFYQTILFKIAVLLLFVGLVAAAVYIYKKRPFEKKIKYKSSSLDPQFAEVCVRRLKHLMEEEKVYHDEHITLQSLAEKLSIEPYILSRLLNEKLNSNFSDYINSHRIEEAKEIMVSPEGAETKITAVALDVGFNSQTAFYKAFKKFTGRTPKQYKKEYRI